jgi:hypothetical protein
MTGWARSCSLTPLLLYLKLPRHLVIKMGKVTLGMNSNFLVLFLLDIETILERLSNICSFTVLTLLRVQTPCKHSLRQ